ncbi:Protein ASPM-1 [Aphelenchoides avenae]|nr:Protein ASPM-1 [Aphelenchus avenae]
MDSRSPSNSSVASNATYNAGPSLEPNDSRFSDMHGRTFSIAHSDMTTTPLASRTYMVTTPAAFASKSYSTEAQGRKTPPPSSARSARKKGTPHRYRETIQCRLCYDVEHVPMDADAEERQIDGLTRWVNQMLSTEVDEDINATGFNVKSEAATKILKEALSSAARPEPAEDRGRPSDKFPEKWFRKQKALDEWRKRICAIVDGSDIPRKIDEITLTGKQLKIVVKEETKVFSNIGLQMELLRMFFKFHPLWLRLGLEAVFQTTIGIDQPSDYVRVLTRFISTRLFKDAGVYRTPKYVKSKLVTKEGCAQLHKLFLSRFSKFVFIVEECLQRRVIPNLTCMFVRGTDFKSMHDVIGFVSREIISGTTNMTKELGRIGFKVAYKQDFFEEYKYNVGNLMTDLRDGIVLAKLVEVLTANHPSGANIVSKLRNPGGDRIRKMRNVEIVLAACQERGIDVQRILKPDELVAGDVDKTLSLLWHLVGIHVAQSAVFADRERLSAERVLQVHRTLGRVYDIQVNNVWDLANGRLFAYEWDHFEVGGHVTDFNGPSLLGRALQAAIDVFDFPEGIIYPRALNEQQLEIFAEFYLTKLLERRRRCHAARKIQRWWRLRALSLQEDTLMMADSAQNELFTAGPLALDRFDEDNKENMEAPVSARLSVAQCAEFKVNERHIVKDLTKAIEKLSVAETRKRARLMIALQARIRGHLAREQLKRLRAEAEAEAERLRREKMMCEQAATKIQATWRGYNTRREVERMRTQQEIAAMKIQRFYRRQQARRNERLVHAATLIQSYIRKFLAVRAFKRLKQRRDQERMERAAVLIQATVRRFLAMRRFEHLREEQFQERLQAIVLLQSHWRRCLAQRMFRQLKEDYEERRRRQEEKAAIRLQCFARQILARKEVEQLRREHERRIHAVIVLQAHWRRYLAERLLDNLRAEHRLREEQAAVTIQCAFRRFMAQQLAGRLRHEKLALRERAAVKIQSMIRRFLARCKFHRLREERKRIEKAAVKIQSVVRRFLAQKLAERLRDERKIAESAAQDIQNIRSAAGSDPVQPHAVSAIPVPISVNTQPTTASALPSATPSPEEVDTDGWILLRRAAKQVPCMEATTAKVRDHFDKSRTARDRSAPGYLHLDEGELQAAASKIQAWYRASRWRRANADLVAHLKARMEAFRHAPETEDDLRADRQLPISGRVMDALNALLSDCVSDRQIASKQLVRLAKLSPSIADCIVRNDGLRIVIDSLEDFNRSEAHRVSKEALVELIHVLIETAPNAKLAILKHSPPASERKPDEDYLLEDLLQGLIPRLSHDYNNPHIVSHAARAIALLSDYGGSTEIMKTVRLPYYYDDAIKKFTRLHANDPRVPAMKELAPITKRCRT